ncbi:MAG: lysozyme-like domain-containing protein [Piptocephalis tieghemiana]|nr:MAG: lysozyme-like domain-containing protein [Piptocephalis tieghemiana]
METLTNAFENGKEGFNYTAIEYLGDGRGWTAGRVGFTSGTGDLLTVLERYRDQWAYRGLISTIPTLQRISALPVCDRRGRDDISQLGNLPHDWVLAAEGDLAFRRVQDLVTYEMYLWPSSRFASSVSVHSPLGQAIFYDTIVQHGWQKTESDINIARIIQLTNTTSPAQGEAEYLSQFLRVRRSMLCCYREDMTWPSSAGRVADLQRALEQGNLALNQDIYLESIGVVVGKAGTYSSEGKRI